MITYSFGGFTTISCFYAIFNAIGGELFENSPRILVFIRLSKGVGGE